MTTKFYDALIVGAGHAGAQAAAALRQKGFAGSIALVGGEALPPYERPPLSKDYLAGQKSFKQLLIRPESFWEKREISLCLGQRVEAVDPARKTVTLADGTAMGYGALIWAAGGRARRLDCPGADLRGVHVIRSRADTDGIVAALPEVRNVVVIGGGYIGLEAAAALTKLGKAVTVIEAQPRLLARVAGQALSDFYAAAHRAHGVDIRLNMSVAELVGADGAVTGVRLADGAVLPAQMVIAGIGIIPETEVLIAAGARGGNGVDVDEYCRTSLPSVYAIGDCAAHVNGFAGRARIRIESVQNAADQANAAASAICGNPQAYNAVPWFWSNQYDLKLQTVGISAGHDDAVLRGDPAAGSFSVVYLKQGRVIALDCVNAVKDYVQGRKLILDQATPDKAQLADPAAPLNPASAV